MQQIDIGKTLNEKAKEKIIAKIGVWHNIRVETYETIIPISEKNYEDVVNEDLAITIKATTMLSALLLFVGSFAGYIFGHFEKVASYTPFIAVSATIVIITVICFGILFLPRLDRRKGLQPSVAIPKEIIDRDNSFNQKQLIYFNYLVSLEEYIDYKEVKIKDRLIPYKIGLYLFLLLMICLPFEAVYIISSLS